MTMWKRIFQSVICLCCWLTFSPLFFFQSKWWKLLGNKFRWVALLISPLFFMIYIPTGFFVKDYFKRRCCAIDRDRIERIAHVAFPDFSIYKYEYGIKSFQGDYTDVFTVEFEEELSEYFYQILDSLVHDASFNEHTYWSKKDNYYFFSSMWGNGLTVPEGEDKEGDGTFSIELERGSKQAVICSGNW